MHWQDSQTFSDFRSGLFPLPRLFFEDDSASTEFTSLFCQAESGGRLREQGKFWRGKMLGSAASSLFFPDKGTPGT